MKGNIPFTITFSLVLSTLVNAQSSCYFYPQDGTTEIDVGEGFFNNPEFCNKECECVRSFPDFESGIPLDTTICGCFHNDKTTSELYCLVVGEMGPIPELGLCECTQRELPTLSCEPFTPTEPPLIPPTEPSSSMTPAPTGGQVSEPSISPASAGGVVPETLPVDAPDASPSETSEAMSRNHWWLLTVSCYILLVVALV